MDILRLFLSAQHTERQPKDTFAVAAHQRVKSLRPTCLRHRDELSIRTLKQLQQSLPSGIYFVGRYQWIKCDNVIWANDGEYA